MRTKSWLGRGNEHSVDVDIDETIILRWMRGGNSEGVIWINLSRDRNNF